MKNTFQKLVSQRNKQLRNSEQIVANFESLILNYGVFLLRFFNDPPFFCFIFLDSSRTIVLLYREYLKAIIIFQMGGGGSN